MVDEPREEAAHHSVAEAMEPLAILGPQGEVPFHVNRFEGVDDSIAAAGHTTVRVNINVIRQALLGHVDFVPDHQRRWCGLDDGGEVRVFPILVEDD